MLWYILKRLLQMIPVFFGATLLIYLLVFAMPGDPVAALGGDKPLSPAVVERIREQYHLNDPLWQQYLYYIKGIFTGDFGTTFSGQPIIDQIARAVPITVRLAIIAIIVETVFGIAAGVLAGLKKGTWIDQSLLVVSLIVIAVPTFVIGFLAQYLLGVKWGVVTINVGSNANWANLMLPGFVLGLVSFAYVLRLTRTSIGENIASDHVRTARAKGLSEGRVTVVHILRNSLIPVVTFIGADLGSLMGGAVVTEGIFNIPGIGFNLWDAIKRGESTKIVSLVTFLVIVYLIANLLVDLLYALLDPRIRYERSK